MRLVSQRMSAILAEVRDKARVQAALCAWLVGATGTQLMQRVAEAQTFLFAPGAAHRRTS